MTRFRSVRDLVVGIEVRRGLLVCFLTAWCDFSWHRSVQLMMLRCKTSQTRNSLTSVPTAHCPSHSVTCILQAARSCRSTVWARELPCRRQLEVWTAVVTSTLRNSTVGRDKATCFKWCEHNLWRTFLSPAHPPTRTHASRVGMLTRARSPAHPLTHTCVRWVTARTVHMHESHRTHLDKYTPSCAPDPSPTLGPVRSPTRCLLRIAHALASRALAHRHAFIRADFAVPCGCIWPQGKSGLGYYRDPAKGAVGAAAVAAAAAAVATTASAAATADTAAAAASSAVPQSTPAKKEVGGFANDGSFME